MNVQECRACGAIVERSLPYCERCEYMTVAEVRDRLHICRGTYYNLVAARRLNPRKIGVNRVLVWRPEVEMLLEWRPHS